MQTFLTLGMACQTIETCEPYISSFLHKPPNFNTTPPEIAIDCSNSKYQSFLTGFPLEKDRFIIDFFPMLHELDILEMRLYEMEGLVDNHVIYESTLTHRGIPKKLHYHDNRQRFVHFKDKIIHFVESDAQHHGGKHLPSKGNIWEINSNNWKNGFIMYSNAYKVTDPNAIVIAGDLDEILSREIVAHLKKCEIKSFPLIGNINMYIHSLKHLHDSDHRVLNQKYTLRFPTVTTYDDCLSKGSFQRIYNTKTFVSLPFDSGSHLVDLFISPEYLAYKYMSAAEGRTEGYNLVYNDMGEVDICNRIFKMRKHRIKYNTEDLHVPWIVKQNQDFYSKLYQNVC